MSFELQTLNKGKIDAGYFSVFTDEVRMGDFSIPTEKFCKFVADLATGIGKDAYMKSEVRLLKIRTTEDDHGFVIWNGKNIAIGKYNNKNYNIYEISGKEFGIFAEYIFGGGWLGWKKGETPSYVTESLQYVAHQKKSEKLKGSFFTAVWQKHQQSLEQRLL